MKHSIVRILLALVVQLNLELVQLEVKIAFLHNALEEEIYMTQPKRFKVVNKENWICKLKRLLYGLNNPQGSGTSDLIGYMGQKK